MGKWAKEHPEEAKKHRLDWYYRNRDTEIKKTMARTKKRVSDMITFLDAYRSERGCQQCGERDPACLDFHHRDPSTKLGNVLMSARKSWGMKRILAEIEKCDILCSNCHRKHHRDKRKRASLA